MGLSKLVLKIALSIVNVCTFFLHPKWNRITFVSLTSDVLSGDFLRLSKALEKEHRYDLRYNLIVFKQNIWGQIAYFFNCLKQLVEYKRSALVILNDNNFVISVMKPRQTKVLQIWHAPGAVKKFGNQIKRQYKIRNYDAVICSAPYWKECFAEAFGVFPEQVYPTGMPRIDDLYDQSVRKANRDAFYQKYPQTKGKRLILYAPTFRGNIIDGFQIESLNMSKIDPALKENTLLLYKFHPLLGDVQLSSKKAIDVNAEDLYTLMEVSDCLISDYSSVFFDYSLLNKPMLSFVPDLEMYKKTIGLNIAYEKEFPGPICKTEEEICAAIRNLHTYDHEKLQSFRNRYIVDFDGKNTERIVHLINSLLKKAQ